MKYLVSSILFLALCTYSYTANAGMRSTCANGVCKVEQVVNKVEVKAKKFATKVKKIKVKRVR